MKPKFTILHMFSALISSCILFVCLVWPVVTLAATLDEANALEHAQNYTGAKQAYLSLAALGNTEAMYRLGLLEARDVAHSPDFVAALAWLKLAVASGHHDASMADSIEFHLSRSEKRQAANMLRQLERKYGFAVVKERYLPVEMHGYSAGKDYAPAQLVRNETLEHDNGKLTGFVDLSFTVQTDGTTRDHQVIFATSKRVAEKGLDQLQQYIYHPAQLEDRFVPEYFKKVRIQFNKKPEQLTQLLEQREASLLAQAKTKSADGAYQFAEFLSLSSDGKANYMPWLVKAAQNGSTAAKFELGRNLLYGNQCMYDYAKSEFWLKEATKERFAQAEMLLGLEKVSGQRFEKDNRLGLLLLQKASNNQLTPAKLKFAHLMAVHPDKDFRRMIRPEGLVASINKREYADLLTYYETLAIIEQGQNNMQAAGKWQRKLIAEAKKHDLPTEPFIQAMLQMENKQYIVTD